ncbi:MAG: methyltransferase domain-containing protein [Proteobacteria bacterium]|nr:methyltransferase domain-containing protein [Pseudomonadota bacterium]
MSASPAAATPEVPLDAWWRGPFGRRLIAAEREQLKAALEDVFGTTCIQVGRWGPPDAFLPLARTTRAGLVADPGSRGDLLCHPSALALQSQSVDAVILPHTLEFEPDPHEVLREVERVLVGEGHVLILGLEPVSAWAVRHYFARRGFPPGRAHLLSRGRLRDWLRLLGFDVLAVRRFVHVLPVEALARGTLARGMERFGRHLDGRTGNAYLMKARKRVYTLTPIRPRRRPVRVLAPVVESP